MKFFDVCTVVLLLVSSHASTVLAQQQGESPFSTGVSAAGPAQIPQGARRALQSRKQL